MINLNLKSAKGAFFDRAVVFGALSKARRKALSRIGAFVRQRARTSIRKRGGVSPPGGPPYSHEGLLRKHIYFAYDRVRESVVIGPSVNPPSPGRRTGPTVPELLEYGGKIPGDGSEIFVSTGPGRDAKGRHTKGGRTRITLDGTLNYKPRPFMGPAFAKEQPGFAQIWKDSVR